MYRPQFPWRQSSHGGEWRDEGQKEGDVCVEVDQGMEGGSGWARAIGGAGGLAEACGLSPSSAHALACDRSHCRFHQ